MKNISQIVQYINDHIDNRKDELIVRLLNGYIHSAYRYFKRNIDGTYFSIQPGYLDEKVISFTHYYDKGMEGNHKAHILMLFFTDDTVAEISLYAFKKYCRRMYKYRDLYE